MKIRTRLAPSPTGEIHVGTMRTLLYDYALAKQTSGELILRIEDTDRERYVEGAEERALKVIEDYGLSWDEGPKVGGPQEPYFQSQRLDIYKKYAIELVEKGFAYYCFCTQERLEKLREEQRKEKLAVTKYDKHCLSLTKEEVEKNLKEGIPYVIRLKVPSNEEIEVEDLVLGKLTFPSNDIDDQVLMKSDGFPTYHLAVVVDDHLMNITHILRGREWLPSTPKHVLLYKAFGWRPPKFVHLPLLREVNSTKKLSKRTGSVNAADFLKDGYLPEALLNFMMFLGWNPGTEKEIYSLEEFVKDFSIGKIQTSEMAAFDRQKLLWFNGMYIRNMSTEELWNKVVLWHERYLEKMDFGKYKKEFSLKVLDLVKERMKTLAEFNDLTSYFYFKPFVDKSKFIEFSVSLDKAKEIIKNYLDLYRNIPSEEWTKDNLDKLSHEYLSKYNYKPKEAFMTLRYATCGVSFTPPLFDVFNLIGKEETTSRLEDSLR
ncbi:glutamate--tRNA ligase [candidate division WWE3 bacterium]|uniref:Glutamate--tRNA ligase n=1 Tax=candidate division WWE3 bacterium TaxID=2053526 RepID=A0A7X9HTG1_UNCKA|nr:glutamate--tRNA ligase [candidate division WWE3 bacterium]